MKIETTSTNEYRPVVWLTPETDEDELFLKQLGDSMRPHGVWMGGSKKNGEGRWGMHYSVASEGDNANRDVPLDQQKEQGLKHMIRAIKKNAWIAQYFFPNAKPEQVEDLVKEIQQLP